MSLKELVKTVHVRTLISGDIYIDVAYKQKVADLDRLLVASEIGNLILEQINRPADSEWTADKIMEREGK